MTILKVGQETLEKGGLANYGPNREVYVRCWRQREEHSFRLEAARVFCNHTQSA